MTKVLIVDDDPAVLSVATLMIETVRPEWKLTSICDPLTVEQILSEQSFDAVISDLEMPGMPGISRSLITASKLCSLNICSTVKGSQIEVSFHSGRTVSIINVATESTAGSSSTIRTFVTTSSSNTWNEASASE